MAALKNIPPTLWRGLAAMVVALGVGGGAFWIEYGHPGAAYLQSIAARQDTSDAVKIAHTTLLYFESSNNIERTRKAYAPPEGAWNPTICNGITNAVSPRQIKLGDVWTVAECLEVETRLLNKTEAMLERLHPNWSQATRYQQASIISFTWNKGETAYRTSTMRRLFDAGDFVGACEQNPRWVYATVGGVKKVLPGLVTLGNANEAICKLTERDFR